MKEFKINDLVLPDLALPDPCPVRIKITDKYIFLFVGQRDWQWRLNDGSLVGTGTGLCQSATPNSQMEQRNGTGSNPVISKLYKRKKCPRGK